GGVAPAPQQQGRDAGTLGGELQAAPGNHRQPADFADDSGEARCAQPLFDRPRDVVIARRADQHEARGIEPICEETGAVEIGALQAPQDGASAEPGEDGGGKPCGGGAVLLVAALPEDLVDGAEREPAAGQRAVDRGDAKRQDAVADRRLDLADALAQRGEGGGGAGAGRYHVYYLFSLSSIVNPPL